MRNTLKHNLLQKSRKIQRKKTDESRGLDKLEKEPRKLPKKERKPKHKEHSSQGPIVKSSTRNKVGPSRKLETKKEPKKSQSIPKK
jgi:hypothetical protein